MSTCVCFFNIQHYYKYVALSDSISYVIFIFFVSLQKLLYYHATQSKQFKGSQQTQLVMAEGEMIIHLVKLTGRNVAHASHPDCES